MEGIRYCDQTEVWVLTGFQIAQDRASCRSDGGSSKGCWQTHGSEREEVKGFRQGCTAIKVLADKLKTVKKNKKNKNYIYMSDK